MLLVIDVGNTHIVLGVYEDKTLINNWRIATDKSRTSDEYGLLLEQLFRYHKIDIDDIEDVIISSVVPTLMHALEAMSLKYFKRKPYIIGPGIKTGMNIKYDNPKEVGADRIVNAVGAYEKYGGPIIIVDFGTAITFCAVSRSGDYLGGAIAPGVEISSEALFMRTAKLPKVELQKPDRVICKNTVNSIQAGLAYGYVGLVDYITEMMKEELKYEGEVKNVVATGGLANFVAEESKTITKVDKYLTLEGLRIIYERNK